MSTLALSSLTPVSLLMVYQQKIDCERRDGVPLHVFSHGNFLGALTGRAGDAPIQVQAFDYYAAVASIAAPAVDV